MDNSCRVSIRGEPRRVPRHARSKCGEFDAPRDPYESQFLQRAARRGRA
jgi:hypothetical protein